MHDKLDPVIVEQRPFILESFFYADECTEHILPYCGDFLLDSGAFTFMQGKGGSPDWDEYVDHYVDFIKRNRVQKYFELDIDSVVGYDKVKRIRADLERKVGWQSIPVWHVSRGKEEFIRHCKEYPYVAIGGLVDGAKKGEYARKLWQFFPWFIKTAHQNGAKIHALGFTSMEGIQKFHFDSVDSTRWNCARFGRYEYFDGKQIQVKDWRKDKIRLKSDCASQITTMCFKEWIKFQKYAETHL